MKSFFRWLQKGGAILVDPAEKVVQHSVFSPIPEVLTDSEIDSVKLAADRYRRSSRPDARPYTLLALLLDTGVKKSECLGIHINHIDLTEKPGEPYVFIRYASPANRYKERNLTLPEEWIPAYQEYLIQYNPVDRLLPWSPRRLDYLLEDIGRAANLPKHLSFDMCRWTSVLQDYLNHVDPELEARIVTHNVGALSEAQGSRLEIVVLGGLYRPRSNASFRYCCHPSICLLVPTRDLSRRALSAKKYNPRSSV